MRTTHITRRNQWFQRVVTVQTNRNKRWRERLFLVEGVRAIGLLADQTRWEVAALLYDDRAERSQWADKVIATLACGEHLMFSEALFAEISERDEGSELLALVRIPESVTGLPGAVGDELVLLLDRPMNPGNLGSIIRSCDALDCSKVVLFGHGADPFDPVAVRATTGSLFSVDLFGLQCSRNDLAEWFEAFAEMGGRLLGTSAHATTPIWSADLSGPLVLMSGNETTGLQRWLREQCQDLVGVQMTGVASSLNVACATTLSLYEAVRQRHAAPAAPVPTLAPE